MDREGGPRLVPLALACLLLLLLVPRAVARPVASFVWTPQEPVAGETVTFDGAASYDDAGGTIVEWRWTFGDGSGGTGNLFGKAYANAGTYEVVLHVRNNFGAEALTNRLLTIREGPSPLSLVPFEHPSGFRVPIPSAWNLVVDELFEGTVFEVTVTEPVPGADGFMTNVIVDTDRDPSVRETQAYLNEQVDFLLEELRRESPNAYVRDGPTHLRVANHSAVSVTVVYQGDAVIQRLVAVVSDPHDRYWILVLTTSEAEFGVHGMMFDEMVSAFEITLPAPALSSGLLAVSVGVVLAAVVAVIVIASLAARSRRARAAALAPPLLLGATSLPTAIGPRTTPQLPTTQLSVAIPTTKTGVCASCGTPAMSARDRFCVRCGEPFVARTCATCGAPAVGADDRFCFRCGAPYAAASLLDGTPPPAPTEAPPPPDVGPDTKGDVTP